VAIVTGVSRGAGRGIAFALSRNGCTVYVAGRTNGGSSGTIDATAIDATAAAVTSAGGKGMAVVTDQADDAQVAALFERTKHGHGRLDVLVNNACKAGVD